MVWTLFSLKVLRFAIWNIMYTEEIVWYDIVLIVLLQLFLGGMVNWWSWFSDGLIRLRIIYIRWFILFTSLLPCCYRFVIQLYNQTCVYDLIKKVLVFLSLTQ